MLIRCRFYLKAFYLSNICTTDGNLITKGAWEVNKSLSVHSNEAIWPHWGKPGKSDIESWKKALHVAFSPHLQHRLTK